VSSSAAGWIVPKRSWEQYLPDFHLGLQNLLQHKLRSLLTMLGMIFGVAAVVSMLSIGAGAQQQVMASSSKWAFTTSSLRRKKRTISRSCKKYASSLPA